MVSSEENQNITLWIQSSVSLTSWLKKLKRYKIHQSITIFIGDVVLWITHFYTIVSCDCITNINNYYNQIQFSNACKTGISVYKFRWMWDSHTFVSLYFKPPYWCSLGEFIPSWCWCQSISGSYRCPCVCTLTWSAAGPESEHPPAPPSPLTGSGSLLLLWHQRYSVPLGTCWMVCC